VRSGIEKDGRTAYAWSERPLRRMWSVRLTAASHTKRICDPVQKPSRSDGEGRRVNESAGAESEVCE